MLEPKTEYKWKSCNDSCYYKIMSQSSSSPKKFAMFDYDDTLCHRGTSMVKLGVIERLHKLSKRDYTLIILSTLPTK